MSHSLWFHGLQHTRFLHPPLSPRVCSNLCPLSQWCYITISSSATSFSFCFQPFLFTSGSQILELQLRHQSFQWIFRVVPLGLTGLISLQSKGLSSVFSSTIICKHEFFGAQPFYGPTLTSIHDYWKIYSFHYTELCRQSNISAF